MHWKTTPAERHICVDLPGEVSRPHPHETAASGTGTRRSPSRSAEECTAHSGSCSSARHAVPAEQVSVVIAVVERVVGVNLPRQRLLGVVEQASSDWRSWQRASPTCGRAAQQRSPGSMPSRQDSRPPSGAVRRLPRSGPGPARIARSASWRARNQRRKLSNPSHRAADSFCGISSATIQVPLLEGIDQLIRGGGVVEDRRGFTGRSGMMVTAAPMRVPPTPVAFGQKSAGTGRQR